MTGLQLSPEEIKRYTGAVEIYYVSIEQLPQLSRSRRPVTAALMQMIVDWSKLVKKMERGKGQLCLNCNTEFWRRSPPHSWVLIVPFAKPNGIVTGVCHSCRPTLSHDAVLAHVRKIWPDAHSVQRPVTRQ